MRVCLVLLLFVLVLAIVGCQGFKLAQEEQERINSIVDEMKAIAAEIKAMEDSGNIDPLKFLEMANRTNVLRMESAAILQKAKERGLPWYEYIGMILGGALGYAGVIRPVRKRFFPEPAPGATGPLPGG